MIERVALVGTPNSGKTTLFNWITGSRQKVVNYPGSTVDYSLGHSLPVYGNSIEAVDTPGTYSLFPKSSDEEVTVRALYDQDLKISAVVIVIDACQISRQLHLVKQLKEIGYPIVVALTMVDLMVDAGGVDTAKMSQMLGVPVIPINGLLGGGVKELIQAVVKIKHSESGQKIKQLEPWSEEKRKNIFTESAQLSNLLETKIPKAVDQTAQIDKVLLHPYFGLLIFIATMVGLFSSIYFFATPFMDLIDGGFSALIDLTKEHVSHPLLSNFISDGIIAGVGAVIIFVPQIFILFLGISFLEDSGYLARAATLIDRPLSAIGLNGKAFVPLLSGFACAIPAMMATRAINSKKAKWLTMFIIPLMTCSARLPVYALLLGFLFAGRSALLAGSALAVLYLMGILVAAILAGILNKFININEKSFFMLELPIYRRPQVKTVVRNSYKRTKSYLVRSGPVIFFFAILVWIGTTFPNYQAEDSYERISTSYASQMGQMIEPIFKPMGADWRVGVGLLSAFAAREVFVSTLAIIMHVSDEALESDNEESLNNSILTSMREAKWVDGAPLFTIPSVLALLIFFVVALQCTTTTAVAYREMRSKGFALVQLASMNLLAYVLAVLVYQIATYSGL
ncbi:MAG: ferrous iron transporter B [Bdellovibrionota bacterium]